MSRPKMVEFLTRPQRFIIIDEDTTECDDGYTGTNLEDMPICNKRATKAIVDTHDQGYPDGDKGLHIGHYCDEHVDGAFEGLNENDVA